VILEISFHQNSKEYTVSWLEGNISSKSHITTKVPGLKSSPALLY
jgi:hypothetical protein